MTVQPEIARAGAYPADLISARLAKALAHPMRVLILVELNDRELSPKEFRDLTGSAEPIELIANHFERLAQLGCIERVATRRTGRTVEAVYRAIRRALFDDAAWAALPHEKKKGATGSTFSTYVGRIAESISSGTFTSRPDSQFTWASLRYDEPAWSEMVTVISALFWYSQDLRVEAQLRLADSNDPPINCTSGLALIESPPDSACLTAIGEFQAAPFFLDEEGALFFDQHLAAAMTHPLRIRILVALRKWPMSPKQFYDRFGTSLGVTLSKVSQHFRRLEELHCIEEVDVRGGKRGRPEHIFAPCRRTLFDGAIWEPMPPSLQEEVGTLTVTTYIEAMAASVMDGVIDERSDSHLSWTGMRYDEEAWLSYTEALRAVARFAEILAEETRERIPSDRLSEATIPVVVGLGCFPSPRRAKPTSEPTWAKLERQMRPDRLTLRKVIDDLLSKQHAADGPTIW